jgi:hypothetical protein
MQKTRRMIALCTLFLFSSSVQSMNTGSQILSYCESDDGVEKIACSYFIQGVQNHIRIMSLRHPESSKVACLPLGITPEQTQKIFIKFANESPKNLHQPAAMIIDLSLLLAFPGPCSKE